MTKQVVIIGAGIGGLATANLLAKAGYKVSVYEKNDQPGGRAGKLEINGFTYDTGPSWYLMPRVFEHYFGLFDRSIDKELNLSKLSPAYKVFFESHAPVVITSDIEKDASTFDSIEPGSGEKLKNYVKKGQEIYDLSLEHFLYTNFTSNKDLLKPEILRRARTMAKLAMMPIDRYVGQFVTDLRLRQILEYPMVFLGSSPFSAPAIYSLMSALDFGEGVFYPQGGLYRIIDKLVEIGDELGVKYHYNSPTKQILAENGQAIGISLENGQEIKADVVISNTDLHHTETRLLAKENQSYPESYWKKLQAGPSALLMYLGVKNKIPNLEHHNLFFIDDWKENFESIFDSQDIPFPASLYICKPSSTDKSVAPKGNENMFVLVPLPAGVNLEGGELEQLADRYLSLIETKLSIPDLKGRLVVKELFSPNDFKSKFNAWQNTALGPSHILRQSAMFRTANKSRKLDNLYYVGGSTVPGVGLPMCLIGAELIYKRLAGDRRGGPISRIEPLGETHDSV